MWRPPQELKEPQPDKIDENGLGWGTLWGSLVLLALLAGLAIYQTLQLRCQPLKPLPVPVNARTGKPQRPNGQLMRTSELDAGQLAHAGAGGRGVDPRATLLIGLVPGLALLGITIAARTYSGESEEPAAGEANEPSAATDHTPAPVLGGADAAAPDQAATGGAGAPPIPGAAFVPQKATPATPGNTVPDAPGTEPAPGASRKARIHEPRTAH